MIKCYHHNPSRIRNCNSVETSLIYWSASKISTGKTPGVSKEVSYHAQTDLLVSDIQQKHLNK